MIASDIPPLVLSIFSHDIPVALFEIGTVLIERSYDFNDPH
jgi:hypothetical protein